MDEFPEGHYPAPLHSDPHRVGNAQRHVEPDAEGDNRIDFCWNVASRYGVDRRRRQREHNGNSDRHRQRRAEPASRCSLIVIRQIARDTIDDHRAEAKIRKIDDHKKGSSHAPQGEPRRSDPVKYIREDY